MLYNGKNVEGGGAVMSTHNAMQNRAGHVCSQYSKSWDRGMSTHNAMQSRAGHS